MPHAVTDHSATARVLVDVDGTELTTRADGMAIARVEVQHDIGRPSSFVVETADLDADQLDWLDGDLVAERRPITLSMGHGETLKPVFSGEIHGVELRVAADSAPKIAFRGYDRLARLARARKTRAFVDYLDSQIFEEIAGEHGLRPKAAATDITHPYVLQSDQTDFAFLSARARAIGHVLRAEGLDLEFAPRGLADSAALSVKLGDDLLEFFARTDILGLAGAVTASGWDADNQEVISATASAGELAARMGGEVRGLALADDGAPETTTARRLPVRSAKEAGVVAAAELEAMALHHVFCNGALIGAPALRPGMVIAVAGMGRRLSGDYWLTRVIHTFDGEEGFRTRFAGRRTAT